MISNMRSKTIRTPNELKCAYLIGVFKISHYLTVGKWVSILNIVSVRRIWPPFKIVFHIIKKCILLSGLALK